MIDTPTGSDDGLRELHHPAHAAVLANDIQVIDEQATTFIGLCSFVAVASSGPYGAGAQRN